jgi:hypothetical protein
MNYSRHFTFSLVLGVLALTALPSYAATLRCERGIINEGDLSFDVLKKCGEPASRQVIDPVVGANGRTPDKSVPVENWVYGPRNGVYRYLRFVDGTLVKIESKPL